MNHDLLVQMSEKIDELAPALVEAQKKISPAIANAENPEFHSSYADLTAVNKVCRDALLENGFAILQLPFCSGNGAGVTTILLHTSSQWIRSSLMIPLEQLNAWSAGSAITMARRYSLAGTINIITEKDDDGNAASKQTAAPPFDGGKPPPSGRDYETDLPPATVPAAPNPAAAAQTPPPTSTVPPAQQAQPQTLVPSPQQPAPTGSRPADPLGPNAALLYSVLKDDCGCTSKPDVNILLKHYSQEVDADWNARKLDDTWCATMLEFLRESDGSQHGTKYDKMLTVAKEGAARQAQNEQSGVW